MGPIKGSKKKSPPGTIEAPEEAPSQGTPLAFPVVGVGASAGGLAAFEAFFSGMPVDTDTGMAFVLVQHLSPDHGSILTELVRRYTSMQVQEAEDGMEVRPDNASVDLFRGTASRLQGRRLASSLSRAISSTSPGAGTF